MDRRQCKRADCSDGVKVLKRDEIRFGRRLLSRLRDVVCFFGAALAVPKKNLWARSEISQQVMRQKAKSRDAKLFAIFVILKFVPSVFTAVFVFDFFCF